MSLQERVYSVLIVSWADNFTDSLKDLLPPSHYSPVDTAANISEAKRALLDRSYDLVLINSPLPDESGSRFAIDVCTSKHSVALLMVKNELYNGTYAKVAEHGVFVLSKPVTKTTMTHALEWMIATYERLRKMEKKTVSIQEKMEEIRLINRAKWLLIAELKMTEPDAHRYIEKQSMDRCITRREMAETIIKIYS